MNKRLLLSAVVLSLSAPCCWAAQIDEIIWEYPGYTITVERAGEVQIDFVLNQQGRSREDIESHFSNYPEEKTRKFIASAAPLEELFRRVDSADWTPVKRSYRAPEGTFEYAGHEVLTRLILKSDGAIVKEVELGSSREKEWPPLLLKTVNGISSIAEQGGPLPRGPFLN